MAASLLDSTLDLLAQVTLAIAAHGATIPDQRYPVGKARLEAAAVVVVSVLFAIGAALVGTHCVERLAEGRDAKVPTLKLDDFVLLTVVVVVKLMLFTVCFHQMRKTKRQGLSQSPVLRALTADHAADVLTNTTALLAAPLVGAETNYPYKTCIHLTTHRGPCWRSRYFVLRPFRVVFPGVGDCHEARRQKCER